MFQNPLPTHPLYIYSMFEKGQHIQNIYYIMSDFKNIGGGRVEPWVDRSRRLLSIYFVQVKYMYAFIFYVSTNGVLQMGVGGGGVASVFFVSFLCKFLVWGRGFRTLLRPPPI